MKIKICNSDECRGEVLCGEHAAATICPYCGGQALKMAEAGLVSVAPPPPTITLIRSAGGSIYVHPAHHKDQVQIVFKEDPEHGLIGNVSYHGMRMGTFPAYTQSIGIIQISKE